MRTIHAEGRALDVERDLPAACAAVSVGFCGDDKQLPQANAVWEAVARGLELLVAEVVV